MRLNAHGMSGIMWRVLCSLVPLKFVIISESSSHSNEQSLATPIHYMNQCWLLWILFNSEWSSYRMMNCFGTNKKTNKHRNSTRSKHGSWVMACRLFGAKPSPEPMVWYTSCLTNASTEICIQVKAAPAWTPIGRPKWNTHVVTRGPRTVSRGDAGVCENESMIHYDVMI